MTNWPLPTDSTASHPVLRALNGEPPVGDNAWFRQEIEPLIPALRSWLRAAFPSLPDIDDVMQEAQLRLLQARQERVAIKCPRTYLYGTARNMALRACQKQRHFKALHVNEVPEHGTLAAPADVVSIVAHNQELALMADAFKTLPDRCREIVMLRTLDGLSYREIALRLGLAEDTVRVQVARGIKRCHDYIQALHAKGGQS